MLRQMEDILFRSIVFLKSAFFSSFKTQIQQINATFKRRKRLNFSRQRRKKILPLFCPDG
jgi:hypothetical protein